ncbi:hypothetical protein AOXY_G24462 [Acipenser oxyrinchus oxyrinchus]|uniref:Uncharacterized protein n=1 Tax=Acipenser oxyrinchus oxyrinchus TaxID=40147 RepID=A0AAD8CV75_ACIOX|nr:hypothetical protein AOXY_G24462 [Acipenser oxyrinchus oxyrinchus]
MSNTVRSASGAGSEGLSTCANPGNPVFSCMIKPATLPNDSGCFPRPQNPLYKTTSSNYGYMPPAFETAPCAYHPMSQTFSEHLRNCGMYRNQSLNTVVDKSRVHDCPYLQNTL